MRKAIKKLKAIYDYYTHRYQFLVDCPEYKEDCYYLLRQVFSTELQRQPDDPHADPAAYLHDILTACYDKKTKKIVACMQNACANAMKDHNDYLQKFHIPKFPEAMWDKIITHIHLAVQKEYRSGLAGLFLLNNSYHYFLNKGYVISTCYCEPKLYTFYSKLGYQTLGEVMTSSFGARIPMYMVVNDYAYLKKCCSPFFAWAKKSKFPPSSYPHRDLTVAIDKIAAEDHGIGLFSPEEATAMDVPLFQGISLTDKLIFLKNAVKVRCPKNTCLIAKAGGGRTMGLILSGECTVLQNNQEIAKLIAGDIFGEIAFLLHTARSADVVTAANMTTVVYFNIRALDYFDSKPKVLLKLHQNIEKYLIERLQA